MSTGAIVAIIVVALIILAVVMFVLPRARARANERKVVNRREEVATAHREQADDRLARAEYAEQEAQRERAEADLHQARANLHERGMADDELDAERERLSRTEREDR